MKNQLVKNTVYGWTGRVYKTTNERGDTYLWITTADGKKWGDISSNFIFVEEHEP